MTRHHLMRARLMSDIVSLFPSKQASEAKLAGVEAQSRTRIQQLDADVERVEAEIDATSRKWKKSMEQLQMVSEELESTKSGASLWIPFLVWLCDCVHGCCDEMQQPTWHLC